MVTLKEKVMVSKCGKSLLAVQVGFEGGTESAFEDPNTFFASDDLVMPSVSTLADARILVLALLVNALLRTVSPLEVKWVVVELVTVLVVHFLLNVVDACAHVVHDSMGLVILPVNIHTAVAVVDPSSHAIKGPLVPSNGVPEPRRARAVNVEHLKKKI
jgi:hypothetical protein